MKLKKLLGASIMALSLMLTAAPLPVFADDETNDVYVTSVETAAKTLTEEQYKMYAAAKKQLAEIAEGKRDYSVLEINVLETFGQEALDNYNYTLEELGVTESQFDSEGYANIDAGTAFQMKWEADAGFNYYSNGGSFRINHAIFLSLGYELYWHDRAAIGYGAWPVRCRLKTLDDGTKVVGMDETSYIPLSFGVSKKYQGEGRDTYIEQWYRDNNKEVPNFTVNTAVTAQTSEQVLMVAREVVAANAGKTDMEKLYAYKDYICSHVEYATDQSQYVGTNTDMGDPSQVTYVFDEDSSTNVVCEGYAKAFKLLCDLSTFQDETLKCNIVMGPASGSTGLNSYGEGHMWNIVTIGGKNYIADVTNTDTGSVGESGVYFLVGGNKFTSWQGSGYSMSGKSLTDTGSAETPATSVNHSMNYIYDSDTVDAYAEADLKIDANSPVVFETLAETGRYVAQQMKARKELIVVSCAGASSSVDLRTAVVNEAFKHTGEPGYGDNLKRQIDSYIPSTSNNTVIYKCKYFDKASDVEKFEQQAETLYNSFNFTDETSDYDKIKTINDWVRTHIRYLSDYGSAEAPRHTASGALLGRAAVCEGYANLTYYLLLKAGIDNRIVVSADHAWNIVKLGNWYYNIDTTWDATFKTKFFLKTDDYYTDLSVYEYNDHHIRLASDDCSSPEFYKEYPMTRYNYGEEPAMTETTVTVSFDDEDNPAARPESVTVTLNDGKYDYPVKLNEANSWTSAVSVPEDATYTATTSTAAGYTAEVTGDLTNGFSAEYVLNHYTVTWINSDSSILETDENVAYGLVPEYNGETPVREPSEYYNYTFKGWTPEIKAVTADVSYRATFSQDYRSSIDYVDSITLSETSYVYDGTEKRPEVTVIDYRVALTEGVDYTVAYENNINAGTASVILTGINKYRSTSTKTFTIEKAEQKLTVTPAEVTLTVGETANLTVEADDAVTYASNDETIATVTDGKITAVGAGETTVKVTVPEKDNYKAAVAEIKVTVNKDMTDVSSYTISLDPESYVYDGAEKKPAVTVSEGETVLTEGTDYEVAFENNINAGTAKVTVTGIGAYKGTASKEFTIEKAEQTLTVTPVEVALKVGETADLTAEAIGEVTYASADETVAAVEAGRITAVGAGETVITVTAAETDNYKAASAEVKVSVAEAVVEAESIEVTPKELSLLIGKTETLTATVLPENTTDKTVVWTTSDDTVATVDENGTVTAVGAGTATITAKTVNGLTAECTVTVEDDYVLRNIEFMHSCSFGNDLSINYYVLKDALAGYENIRMEISKEVYNKDGSVSWKTTELKTYTEADVNDVVNYRFAYKGIAVKEMGAEVRMVLKADKNGKTYSTEEDVYGVGMYAYSRLEKSTDDTFKTLLVDMLNYGAEAQVYFNYNTDKLVNAELTDAQKALGTTEDVVLNSVENTTETEGATASFYGKSAVFNSNVELKYYMQFAEDQKLDNVRLVLTYTTIDGTEKSEEIKAEDFAYEKKYEAYTAKLISIAAKDVRSTVTAKIYDGDTLISNTLDYSLETYAFNRLNKSTDEVFKSFLRAFMKYGFSAETYFRNQQNR